MADHSILALYDYLRRYSRAVGGRDGSAHVLTPLWRLPVAAAPDPAELPPPTELSETLLCVSRLFSCACDLVTVEKTERSAVEVTLVSASERLEPVCSQSSRELASSMLGSKENFEPGTESNGQCRTARSGRLCERVRDVTLGGIVG
ncbi:hypothetical protein NQ318_016765 [Aromia moschata]|uniref:Uncharacterized protein n=1 Tax=Aromia moschata TaxID=1265417 RepID=A0AAV8Y4Y8_9CUCU|nr:hypothetical protein NQ318_016765 [Aromia moschata]